MDWRTEDEDAIFNQKARLALHLPELFDTPPALATCLANHHLASWTWTLNCHLLRLKLRLREVLGNK